MPHTPGPWNCDEEDGCLECVDRFIATPRLNGSGIRWTNERDAYLAAAAPELAEALKLIVSHFGDPLKVARAALDKAGVAHD